MLSSDNVADESGAQQIVSVAIPRPIHGLFTYKVPSKWVSLVQVGGWVKVPFGRTLTHAFIVEPPRPISDLSPELSADSLKDIREMGDPDSVFPRDVLALCRWAHEYYGAPLGEVLNCAAPSAGIGNSKLKKSPRPISVNQGPRVSHILTPDQQTVVEQLEIERQKVDSQVALLHGVTGSGKTEVYIEMARRTLEEGKGVIILVPEIALTSQLHRRFEEGLGTSVGLWHSAVSPGKRRDQGHALRKGELRVVVGARSAVFAPVKNLGLLVVDEEHDSTYKQEDRVRYQARDLAVVRGKFTRSLVVLGSATPSLETLERVREGRYIRTVLGRRIASVGLPRIELVDLRVEEKVEGIRAPFAQKTMEAIQKTLAVGEQVIIYLNRRGFAAFLLCKDCGEVNECKNCSISLTVHKGTRELRCHVCGYRGSIPDFCRKCHGTDLSPMGAGTESLEEELSSCLPGAKVLRLDRDQITSATRLGEILHSFRSGEANVLLGTQLLVKGHDFPGVTLVVVVIADALFRWPDFRASERALQVLKQVSGRAGRGEKAGKVLIQTFNLAHPVLDVIQGNLSEDTFLEGERQLRQALNYPPFGRIVRFRFESPSRDEVSVRSKTVAAHLSSQQDEAVEILGPSESFMEKVNGIYRWDLLLKTKDIRSIHRCMSLVREYCTRQKWQFSSDIDPYST